MPLLPPGRPRSVVLSCGNCRDAASARNLLSRPKPHSSTGCVAELAPGVAVCRRSACRRRLMMGAGLACHGWRRGGLPSAFAGRGHIAVQDAHGASRSLGGRIPRAESTSAPEKPRTECGQPLRTNSPSLRQVSLPHPSSPSSHFPPPSCYVPCVWDIVVRGGQARRGKIDMAGQRREHAGCQGVDVARSRNSVGHRRAASREPRTGPVTFGTFETAPQTPFATPLMRTVSDMAREKVPNITCGRARRAT